MRQGLVSLEGRLAAAVIVGASLLMFASQARAESCCGGGQPALSVKAVADFEGSPQLLLTLNPVGGGIMISRVRDLLLSDSGTLPAILSLLPSANSDQKSAIAAGVAQAARLWLRGDPSIAQQIQQAIADSKDAALIFAYSTAAGNQPIGAVGGGGAGSSGGVGGQTGALGGGAFGSSATEQIGGGGTGTGGFSMTGGVTSAGSITNASTSTSP